MAQADTRQSPPLGEKLTVGAQLLTWYTCYDHAAQRCLGNQQRSCHSRASSHILRIAQTFAGRQPGPVAPAWHCGYLLTCCESVAV